MAASLYNLVYVSVRQPTCTNLDITNILTTSRRNNFNSNTTGILLYGDNRFLQYLEGEKDQLMDLFYHIEKNPLHRQMTLLYHVPIEKRIFPSWQMGYKDLDSDQLDFHTAIDKRERQLFHSLLTQDIYQDIEGMEVLKLFFEHA